MWIMRRLRSSSRIPLETSDPGMSSLMRPLMRSSLPSIRTDQVPSRSQRWLFSSSNSSEETERAPVCRHKDQDNCNEDQSQSLWVEVRTRSQVTIADIFPTDESLRADFC